MPLRTGQQYIDSLKDGRQVWLRGQKVDVTAHPDTAAFVKVLADFYEWQRAPRFAELLTIKSPTSGDVVSSAYLIPQNSADLVRRRRFTEFFMRRTGGVIGRPPDFMALVLLGLYNARDLLAKEDPAFALNAVSYFEYCRENDLCLTHGFGDPSGDRSLPPGSFEYLKVVEESAAGIVVRGAKPVVTLSPYANECLCITVGRPGRRPEEVLCFAVPMNARGVRIICREPLVKHSPEDHPLSAYFDEMDAFVVFDDVCIPKERVFFLRRVDLYEELFRRVLELGSYHVLVRMAVKAEVLLGVCAAMANYLGVEKTPQAQHTLADVISYLETLRAFISGAELNPVQSDFGLALPNPRQVLLGRIHGVQHHSTILQLIRDLSGTAILMAPGHAQMTNPEISGDLQRYLVGKDTQATDRFRMLKLAWDYTCDSFGSRQLLFEMHNAATLAVNKNRLAQACDTGPFVRLAKHLAGIDGELAPGLPESLESSPDPKRRTGAK